MSLFNPSKLFSLISKTTNIHELESPEAPTNSSKYSNLFIAIACLAMAIPVILFYFLLNSGLANIPFWDDYDSVLGFIINFTEQRGAINKILLILLTQHNEYKIIFGNMLFASEYLLDGSINFMFLQMVGNLFVLLVLYAIYKVYLYRLPATYHKILLFIPVPFLIFQLQYWETLDWASPGLQNIPVIAFAVLSLYFLSRNRKIDFATSCTFLILSVFSSGNGLFIIPLGLLMLLQEKQFRRIAPWLATSSILSALYFYKYSFGTGHGLSIDFYLKHFDIRYTLSFLGSAASGNNYHLAIILGIVFLIMIILMITSGFYRRNPPAFYTVLFIFTTALVVSMIRSQYGVAESLSSRYRIYSDILLVMVYIFLLYNNFNRRNFVLLIGCIIAIPFCAYNDYVNYPKLVRRYNRLQDGVSTWMMTGQGLTYPSGKRANMLIHKSTLLGIYSLPKMTSTVVQWPVELENNKPMGMQKNQLFIVKFHNYNYSGNLSITSVGVFQGNLGNTANGRMTVQLCAKSACASGVRPLSESRDNSFFYIPFKTSLNVLPGEKLTLSIRHLDGNKPDALWIWPEKAGYPQELSGPQGPLPGKAIRIALKYQTQEHK
ncbi:hypothetical protein [Acidithiobacillus albertensis]|uniref:hypothetical protein n=1 Tax=Acidithiobacillus albertensis TaxID=119978 RepID=UPI001C06A179|nr:hypothetical protein [Acidithiobacillus albertensis]MBU2742731.1 hypothetical protein [Acidithiobacillus albertensis]